MMGLRRARDPILLAVGAILTILPEVALGGNQIDEIEPNDTQGSAMEVSDQEISTVVRGSFQSGGDIDWYAIEASAGEQVEFRLSQLELNTSPLFLPRLDLYAPSGELLDRRVANGTQVAGYATSPGEYLLRMENTVASSRDLAYELDPVLASYPQPDLLHTPTHFLPSQRYDPEPNIEDRPRSQSFTLGEVTGDGLTDVVLTAFPQDPRRNRLHLMVLRQRSDGYLAPAERWPISRCCSLNSYALSFGLDAGDVDADGDDDVVVPTSRGLEVFVQGPNGLRDPTLLRTRYEADRVVITDFDKDGDNDIVVAGFRAVTLYKNTASGWTERLLIHVFFQDFEVGDVTGDRLPDFVGSRREHILVFAQTARGGFEKPRALLMATGDDLTRWPEGLAIGDVTADGKNDVLAFAYERVNVFEQKNEGFRYPVVSRVLPYGGSTVGDVNGDSQPEFIGYGAVYFMDTEGRVDRVLLIHGGGWPVIGDLTNDGLPDIVWGGGEGFWVSRNGFEP